MLNDLALKHGTDKASNCHNYTRWYEQLFAPRKNDHLCLIEVGVWEGASLRMWREYFPNATITGVDKHDRGIQVKDVNVVISDQDSPTLAATLNPPFDIVIDDASHINALTITTFKNLFPHVISGGMYVIEDLQTSYDPINYDGSHDPSTHHCTAMQFCKRLADEVNHFAFSPQYSLGYKLESVQFFPNMCVITKA